VRKKSALVVGSLPEALGVDLDAHHRVDHDHGGVGDPKRGDGVGDEARLAGRVDQVDLATVVPERCDRGADRHLALLLVSLEVGHCGAVLDLPEPVDHPGLEQHRLVQRGLAAAAVADQRDVAYPVGGLVRHRRRTL
jgi:hypothetical protein